MPRNEGVGGSGCNEYRLDSKRECVFRVSDITPEATDSATNQKEDTAMKSFMASPSTIERKWYVVDATGHTLGRLASEVAKVLRGKTKPIYTPHIDTGDYVIVVNADKIKVTGNKMEEKIYYNHSDYVGGLKQRTLLSSAQLRVCFRRDLLADRCTRSCLFTQDRSISRLHRSLKHLRSSTKKYRRNDHG